MRKRSHVAPGPVVPRPCGHPIIEGAPACLYGRSEPFPLEWLGTPEGDLVEAAWRDHEGWCVEDGRLQVVPNPALLWPEPSSGHLSLT